MITISKFKTLSPLEIQCTLCGDYLHEKDISSGNYVATYKKKTFRMAHKRCYETYLKMIKETK